MRGNNERASIGATIRPGAAAHCHACESRHPEEREQRFRPALWIPACAGITNEPQSAPRFVRAQPPPVMPAKAGIQRNVQDPWIPACAGMTDERRSAPRVVRAPPRTVMPAKAGIQRNVQDLWIPACAGMTNEARSAPRFVRAPPTPRAHSSVPPRLRGEKIAPRASCANSYTSPHARGA